MVIVIIIIIRIIKKKKSFVITPCPTINMVNNTGPNPSLNLSQFCLQSEEQSAHVLVLIILILLPTCYEYDHKASSFFCSFSISPSYKQIGSPPPLSSRTFKKVKLQSFAFGLTKVNSNTDKDVLRLRTP